MPWSVLADLVVIVHVGFVGYVVLGQLAIWLGLACHWGWARNFWFRVTHLTAILIVATETMMKWECPLTTWEAQLRTLAGQEVSEASFMGRIFHHLIFFNPDEYSPWFLTIMHVSFALIVVGTFVLAPPRWRSLPKKDMTREPASTEPAIS